MVSVAVVSRFAGTLTLRAAWEASLFRVGASVLVNGEAPARVAMVDARTGVVSVEPVPVEDVSHVLVESTWHPEVLSAMHEMSMVPEERILEGVLRQVELGLPRFRRVAMHPGLFANMVRRLNARIDFDEATDVTWLDMMTAVGPVRVYSDPRVPPDAISLDVDERTVVLATARDKLTAEQLQKRFELEMELAERHMGEADTTRHELVRRSS